MRAIVVRQGDHLQSIAQDAGCEPDAIWEHERNRELREQRGDGRILAPGDVVFVPESPATELTLRAKTENRFEATVPKVKVRLTLGPTGNRYANAAYEVRGLARPIQGTTDGDGKAEFDVPVHVHEVEVVLEEHQVRVRVRVGHVDPVDTANGVRTRLAQLGYLADPTQLGALPPQDPLGYRERAVRQALLGFQRARDLEPTGEADEATQSALVDAHGS